MMIDIHCHILPGLDDGAKDMEESVCMCAMAAEDGYGNYWSVYSCQECANDTIPKDGE